MCKKFAFASSSLRGVLSKFNIIPAIKIGSLRYKLYAASDKEITKSGVHTYRTVYFHSPKLITAKIAMVVGQRTEKYDEYNA